MKPLLAITLLAILAGACAYVLDGLAVALRVFLIVMVVPSAFLLGYKRWLERQTR